MDLERRTFLKAAAPAIAFPAIIPASALGRDGRPAPGERITFGSIGLGGMGMGDLRNDIREPITPGHLGYVSQSLGRALKWDPKKENVIGDQEADKLLKAVDYRKPWKLG